MWWQTPNSSQYKSYNQDKVLWASDTPDGSWHGTDLNDYLRGHGGNEMMYGGAGNDVLYGGGGNDWMDGGSGNDAIFGGAGDDVMAGGDGDDVITGWTGNDHIFGGAGNDQLWGDGGNDLIYGDAGNDTIEGGAGVDTIFGGDGDDVISGGRGYDLLSGGAGADTFVYRRIDEKDVIKDFSVSQGDRIDLTDFATALGKIDTLAELVSAGKIVNSGADTVLIFGTQTQLTISGLHIKDLTEAQFIFGGSGSVASTERQSEDDLSSLHVTDYAL